MATKTGAPSSTAASTSSASGQATWPACVGTSPSAKAAPIAASATTRGEEDAHEGQPQRELLDGGRSRRDVEGAQRPAEEVDEGEQHGQPQAGHHRPFLRAAEGEGEPQRAPAGWLFRYSSRKRSASSKASAGTMVPRMRGYSPSAILRHCSRVAAPTGTP